MSYYIAHGRTWKKHKYIAIKNGRYIYPSTRTGTTERAQQVKDKKIATKNAKQQEERDWQDYLKYERAEAAAEDRANGLDKNYNKSTNLKSTKKVVRAATAGANGVGSSNIRLPGKPTLKANIESVVAKPNAYVQKVTRPSSVQKMQKAKNAMNHVTASMRKVNAQLAKNGKSLVQKYISKVTGKKKLK